MSTRLPGKHEQVYKSLRRRTALAGAAVFFIPFGLFYLLASYASERYVERQFAARLEGGVATNVELLDDVLGVRLAETRVLGRGLARASRQRRQWPELLRGMVEGNPWYDLVLVADSRGRILAASTDLQGSIEDWEAFRRARGGETLVSDLFFPALTGKPMMVVAAPLAGPNGRPGEVLVAALKLEKLNSRLLRLGVGRTEESFLVNAAGELMSPGRLPEQELARPVFAAPATNPFRGPAGTVEYRDAGGRLHLAAFRRLPSKDYYLVAQVERGELLGPMRQLRGEILLYVAPFLALGIVLAVGGWRYAMNYIFTLMSELCQALEVAQQREQERDLAHRELARRFDEERTLAQEKAQFQAQLAEYEKYAALAQLALGAAHEINNPLLGILTHLELEHKAAGSDEERAEIEQCIEGAKRISATVHGLINYARPAPLQLSKVNLDRLVTDTLGFLRHQPLFRGIELRQEIAAGLPAISADVNQLSQVLMNLLLNAAQATAEGGRITVAAEKVKFADQVEISVADTGCGIPADILPRVMEPFFTTKRGQGTGLGLSISQAYVRSHGGDIQIESVPQRGTRVRITLPIRQEGRPVPELEEVIT